MQTTRIVPRGKLLFCAAGAALVGAGVLLMLIVALVPAATRGTTMIAIAAIMQMAGGCVLALGWLTLVGSGHGGVAPALGAAALPACLVYFRLHASDSYNIETTIAVVGLGYGVFALGHALARGVPIAIRLIGVAAAILVFLAFSAEASHWEISRTAGERLYLAAFVLLIATTFGLVGHLFVTRAATVAAPQT